jgi:hypothetical protein
MTCGNSSFFCELGTGVFGDLGKFTATLSYVQGGE